MSDPFSPALNYLYTQELARSQCYSKKGWWEPGEAVLPRVSQPVEYGLMSVLKVPVESKK